MMDSANALPYESPALPTAGSMPASVRRSAYRVDRYCAIKMMQQPLGWAPTGQRHPERVSAAFISREERSMKKLACAMLAIALTSFVASAAFAEGFPSSKAAWRFKEVILLGPISQTGQGSTETDWRTILTTHISRPGADLALHPDPTTVQFDKLPA
jgi:hypothetical protein